jgi:hypothetical protein
MRKGCFELWTSAVRCYKTAFDSCAWQQSLQESCNLQDSLTSGYINAAVLTVQYQGRLKENTMTLKTTLKLTAAAASMAILAGCATNAALDEVRQTAESAQADAAEARSIATQAQNTANQAQRDAQAALQMSEQNREEMNRMFQRSMQK